MNHFMRPFHKVGLVALLGMGAGMLLVPGRMSAQGAQVLEAWRGMSPLLHSSSQGYLGVWVDDVDSDKAQALKLKEVRGAMITLVDHDAPAGQVGLRVNDVVLQINGENVEGAEQMRRILKEIPAGRKVSLEFSRDGNIQTTSVQLVDHRVMAHDVWNKLNKNDESLTQAPGMGMLPGGGDAPLPGMFHMPIWGSTLNVGAVVEPLDRQMVEYLGVPSGLMVKQVERRSEAALAGMKAKDVILKVGTDAVTTTSDWERAMRANQGKPVQVTILRDGKQQTLTLQVDSKHRTGALQMPEMQPGSDSEELAELEPSLAAMLTEESQGAAKLLQEQSQGETLQLDQNQLNEMKTQAEEMRKSTEALADQLKAQKLELDGKQAEKMKREMDAFRNSFEPQGLEVGPN